MINPHDIMYADANLPGERVQFTEAKGTLTPPPRNTLYDKQWEFPLSASRLQPVDGPGRPEDPLQYLIGWSYWMGMIPANSADMVPRIFYNYYLNLIRDNDRMFGHAARHARCAGPVEEHDRHPDNGPRRAAAVWDLLRQGVFPYEEETHVPFVVVHPDRPGGRRCQAVTSHIDLVPTLAGLTELPAPARMAATKGMPGQDLTPLLDKPEAATPTSVRSGQCSITWA